TRWIMADFEKYKPMLQSLEGGWSDNPMDPGGATMCGVTLKTYRSYYGSDRTKEDLRHITDRQWTRIMKDYWDRCHGDEIISQSVAEIFIDWYINAGGSAIRCTQRALGLEPDGIVGHDTISALNSQDSCQVWKTVRDARVDYYLRLGRKMPVFLKGWMNRVGQFDFKA
ncbi:protein containing DUF847, partial [gut metagenome]